jgi:hypothetical protein
MRMPGFAAEVSFYKTRGHDRNMPIACPHAEESWIGGNDAPGVSQ